MSVEENKRIAAAAVGRKGIIVLVGLASGCTYYCMS